MGANEFQERLCVFQVEGDDISMNLIILTGFDLQLNPFFSKM